MSHHFGHAFFGSVENANFVHGLTSDYGVHLTKQNVNHSLFWNGGDARRAREIFPDTDKPEISPVLSMPIRCRLKKQPSDLGLAGLRLVILPTIRPTGG
ncbi:hypothetical protein [Methylomonas koyamae]|uniref:hypothetical protein n=1 Tax=Methylomonas koyamae TaxID=702114 RepID=UPI0016425BF8|nr:hypothetical protein [Methylomonas koyamae]